MEIKLNNQSDEASRAALTTQAPAEGAGASLMALACIRELTGTQQQDLDATIDAIRAEPARVLLEEALDLVPRMNDDDPIAPALADWCARVRSTL